MSTQREKKKDIFFTNINPYFLNHIINFINGMVNSINIFTFPQIKIHISR